MNRDASETVAALCAAAVAAQQKGNFADVERHCRAILARESANPLACNLLGSLWAQQGRAPEALALLSRALQANPPSAATLSNYAVVLQQFGRFDEALASYDRAVALDPNLLGTVWNRANLLSARGRFAEAVAGYDRLLALRPDAIEAHCNRGLALARLHRLDEALAAFDRATALRPDYAEAWNHKGVVQGMMKRFDDALKSIDRALALNPRSAEAHYNRGVMLSDLHRHDEALASYDQALALSPKDAETLNNRGSVLWNLKRVDDALIAFDKALAVAPDHREALFNRANLQWAHKQRHDIATRDLEHLVKIAPNHPYARGALLHLRMHAGDWRNFDHEMAQIDAGVRARAPVIKPFAYQALAMAPADLKSCAEVFAAHQHPPRPPVPRTTGFRSDKIRVGYVSGEFGEQATAYLTAGLYEAHDKAKFEIIAFDNGGDDGSPMRKRLECAFDKFVDISALSDEAAAQRIAAEGIDILVNLNGYFGKARMGVFAYRPAPIQVNYLGFPGTLGAPYIDILIADRIVIPEDERRHIVENVVYLPDCYQANDDKRAIAEAVPSRSDCGLPQEGLVFCNFNQTYKLTPAMFAIWMRILRATEGSVLWLLGDNAFAAENLRREAEAQGIAGDRLVFAPHIALDRHLARLKQADLFLDSLPYNAHTTASDALWAGVPLLTCRGTTFPGRVAASLLTAVGLPELITETLADYERVAITLAREPARLQSFRDRLIQNRGTCALFDTRRFCRAIESAYSTMAERQRRGEPPTGFAV